MFIKVTYRIYREENGVWNFLDCRTAVFDTAYKAIQIIARWNSQEKWLYVPISVEKTTETNLHPDCFSTKG